MSTGDCEKDPKRDLIMTTNIPTTEIPEESWGGYYEGFVNGIYTREIYDFKAGVKYVEKEGVWFRCNISGQSNPTPLPHPYNYIQRVLGIMAKKGITKKGVDNGNSD